MAVSLSKNPWDAKKLDTNNQRENEPPEPNLKCVNLNFGRPMSGDNYYTCFLNSRISSH